MAFKVTTADGGKVVRNWGYQLQGEEEDREPQPLNAKALAKVPHDLIVIDFSKDGSGDGAFSEKQIANLKKRKKANSVIVSYISIGEVSDYRDHWQDGWTKWTDEDQKCAGELTDKAPAWLGAWNESWPNSRKVRYWDPGWQNIIFNDEGTGWLDQIVAAGFDGVFLDRVDAFSGVADERPTGRAEMIDFVKAIATYARKLKPGFAIVPQNGEDLLLEPSYLATIDGIAKEDLLFGHPNEGQPNSPAEVAVAAGKLTLAVRAGLPVLAVEYVLAKEKTDMLRADLTARGFKPYFGVRTLDRLILPEDLKPAVALAAAAAAAKNAAGAVKRGHAPRQAKAKTKAQVKNGKR